MGLSNDITLPHNANNANTRNASSHPNMIRFKSCNASDEDVTIPLAGNTCDLCSSTLVYKVLPLTSISRSITFRGCLDFRVTLY